MLSLLIPDIPIDVTIGLDQYSFSVSKGQIFNGIINIPNGLHIIHFQNGGIRYGYWFHRDEARHNYYLQYDEITEIFEMKVEDDVVKYDNILHEYKQKGTLAEYPKLQENEQWVPLSSYIDWDQIVKSVENNEYSIYVDSSMTTREENDLLNKTLGNSTGEDEKCLNYTPIKFKSRDAIRQGYEMEDYMDKSYYFNDIIVKQYYRGNIRFYYSELQFSYMNSVIFGNYGSSLQWHSMIEVICFTKKIRGEYNDIMSIIDEILFQQLKILPEEYTEMLLNEDMWRRCLFESFQGLKLTKTRKIIEEKLPELFHNCTGQDFSRNNKVEVVDEDEVEDEGENKMLPPIDSDDEEGPVVVESLIYR
ncbi:A1 cistron-splicing factor Aar2p [Monosporozyma servazzii]